MADPMAESTPDDTPAGEARLSARLRSRSITVTPTDALLRELRQLFGPDRIRLVRT
jgi:hypothetical protein